MKFGPIDTDRDHVSAKVFISTADKRTNFNFYRDRDENTTSSE